MRKTPTVGAGDPLGNVRADRLPRRAGLRASWRDDCPPAVARQIEALEAAPGLRERFSYPFPHNYVLLQAAVRAERSVDDVLLSLRDASAPLNAADEALNDWFDDLGARLGAAAASAGLTEALTGWRAGRACGRNLQGVAWAERACAAARQVLGQDWSLAEALDRTAPHVAQAFADAPPEATGALRVRLFVPPADVVDSLLRLDREGLLHPRHIDRIETAKPGLGDWDGSWPTIQLHPVGEPDAVVCAVQAAELPHELRTRFRLVERYLDLLLDRRQQRSIRSGSRAGSVHR